MNTYGIGDKVVMTEEAKRELGIYRSVEAFDLAARPVVVTGARLVNLGGGPGGAPAVAMLTVDCDLLNTYPLTNLHFRPVGAAAAPCSVSPRTKYFPVTFAEQGQSELTH